MVQTRLGATHSEWLIFVKRCAEQYRILKEQRSIESFPTEPPASAVTVAGGEKPKRRQRSTNDGAPPPLRARRRIIAGVNVPPMAERT